MPTAADGRSPTALLAWFHLHVGLFVLFSILVLSILFSLFLLYIINYTLIMHYVHLVLKFITIDINII